INRISKEDARERSRQDCRNAQELKRNRGLLARRAHAKVSAGHHEIAGTYGLSEARNDVFKAMGGQAFGRKPHPTPGGEHVGVDVVAKYECAAHQRLPLLSIERGSVMCPATAAAATE